VHAIQKEILITPVTPWNNLNIHQNAPDIQKLFVLQKMTLFNKKLIAYNIQCSSSSAWWSFCFDKRLLSSKCYTKWFTNNWLQSVDYRNGHSLSLNQTQQCRLYRNDLNKYRRHSLCIKSARKYALQNSPSKQLTLVANSGWWAKSLQNQSTNHHYSHIYRLRGYSDEDIEANNKYIDLASCTPSVWNTDVTKTEV